MSPNLYVSNPVNVIAAEDYQRIEFGVDEVMDSESIGVKDQLYKVSSTLNPQAPEFILGCQPVQKALQAAAPAADVPDGTHFNSLEGPDSEASGLDNHQTCQDMDGLPGSLGQRERKKKKKRPPGYYNYLDPSGVGGNSSGVVEGGVPVTALVNGHALGGPHHPAEDVDVKSLSGAELSIQGPVTATSTDAAAVAKPVTTPAANQRTCESPDGFSLDLSGSPSSSVGNNATSSSLSSCQSRGMTEGQRTAEQQADNLAPQSPELSDGSQSPNSKSPLPALAAVASPPVAMSITTTELEGKVLADSGLANGLAEPDNHFSRDGLKEDCESVEQPQHSSSDSGGQSAGTEQANSPAIPAAPNATLPKSWASLFHNSKPVPGGSQAFVEVKNVEVASPSVATPEQPEKVVELKNGPVHVSEDSMAPKLAGIIWRCL